MYSYQVQCGLIQFSLSLFPLCLLFRIKPGPPKVNIWTWSRTVYRTDALPVAQPTAPQNWMDKYRSLTDVLLLMMTVMMTRWLTDWLIRTWLIPWRVCVRRTTAPWAAVHRTRQRTAWQRDQASDSAASAAASRRCEAELVVPPPPHHSFSASPAAFAALSSKRTTVSFTKRHNANTPYTVQRVSKNAPTLKRYSSKLWGSILMKYGSNVQKTRIQFARFMLFYQFFLFQTGHRK